MLKLEQTQLTALERLYGLILNPKNRYPYLYAEAIIEIVDVINWKHPDFRQDFEDSRDFNQTIADWATEFLDWWDKEEEEGKDLLYLDEVEDFVDRKTAKEYTVFYTMSGSVTVKANSEEEAKELASKMEIKWDTHNIDFTDITKED